MFRELKREPWEMAFKIATLKIRPSIHSFCETLPWDILKTVINKLFPKGKETRTPQGHLVWTRDEQVTVTEIRKANKRLFNDRKAPGPDGILGGVIKNSINTMENRWIRCFSECLKNGIFP
jgi:hypothetical protein